MNSQKNYANNYLPEGGNMEEDKLNVYCNLIRTLMCLFLI